MHYYFITKHAYAPDVISGAQALQMVVALPESMHPSLSETQRQAIMRLGTPLPIVDHLAKNTYILLSVEVLPDSEAVGFTAHIPGISAYGEGETEEDASVALCEALRGYLGTFSEH